MAGFRCGYMRDASRVTKFFTARPLRREAVADRGLKTGDVDGGAQLALDEFRLIEHALSALDPSKWAILQRSEMKGSFVYRW